MRKESEMEPGRKEYFCSFTILGLALCLMNGAGLAGGVLYDWIYRWLENRGSGAYRLLSRLFVSEWTEILVKYVFVLGAPMLLAWLIVCRMPKLDAPRGRLSLEEGILSLLIASGVGYVLNFAGLLINGLVSSQTGKAIEDMNPVMDMFDGFTPGLVLYMCLVGPVMEELLFRGILLSRARRFGDRTAVVYTAVLFGLMHGNLSQALYTTFVGLVLGYVAAKTGGIRYTAILHIIFNTGSLFISYAGILWLYTGLPIAYLVSGVVLLGYVILLMIGGVYFLCRYGKRVWRELSARNWPPTPAKKYVYLNPGFLLYAGISLAEVLSYLL